jgi:hypothetical protein
MAGNRGYKGVDRRLWTKPTSGDSGGVEESNLQYLNRKLGKNPNQIVTSTLTLLPEHWSRCGFSASFTEGSGSLLFHSPDSAFGASWNSRNCLSIPTIKIWNEDQSANQPSIVSFRVGNCINGGADGSFYGFFGLIPHIGGRGGNDENDLAVGGIYPSVYSDLPWIGWWGNSNDKITGYTIAADSLGQMTVAQGDLIEYKIYPDGLIELYHNNELFSTGNKQWNWNFPQLGKRYQEYVIFMQSNKVGSAGNFGTYDWKMTGVVDENPYFFDAQFNQTMLPISASTWASASVGATRPLMSIESDGTTTVTFRNGSYTTPIYSTQCITGSGTGGIYTFRVDSSSIATQQIAGLHRFNDHANNSYYTNLQCAGRPTALTWGDGNIDADSKITDWYCWNTAAGAGGTNMNNAGKIPLATGSYLGLILTGSVNTGLFGDWGFNWGSNTLSDSQVGFFIYKGVNTKGEAINEYVSTNWQVVGMNWYHEAGYGREAQCLTFNDGTTGKYMDVRIGDHWYNSSSLSSP